MAKLRDICKIPSVKLSEVAVGDTVMIGDHEMVVLDQFGKATALIRKDMLAEMCFGGNNNYNGSDADDICNAFAEEMASIVGEDNVLLHEVDLTADDGLKDYGKVQRKASLRTAQMQREYVEILDKYRLDVYEWLATACSTPTHGWETAVKCVSPSGYFCNGGCGSCFGVRPFCILKSTIFVSKKEEKNLPTADDVEVVRCKDCINQMGDGACCVIDEGGADDFFCSYGERRTE